MLKIQSQINNNRYIQQNKFNIFKKIIFVIIIQTLNSKLIFNLFFKFVRFSHKKSFNFFKEVSNRFRCYIRRKNTK